MEADGALSRRRHLHTDHLGSTRLITDANGTPVSSLTFFPFGENVVNPGQGAEELQFTGHERDDNDAGLRGDLDYMHARYYSPHLGRFLSTDPVTGDFAPTKPLAWNKFRYGLNDPINLIDPDGRQELIPETGPTVPLPTLSFDIQLGAGLKLSKFLELGVSSVLPEIVDGENAGMEGEFSNAFVRQSRTTLTGTASVDVGPVDLGGSLSSVVTSTYIYDPDVGIITPWEYGIEAAGGDVSASSGGASIDGEDVVFEINLVFFKITLGTRQVPLSEILDFSGSEPGEIEDPQ
jgi:RHS repeat-associated protein